MAEGYIEGRKTRALRRTLFALMSLLDDSNARLTPTRFGELFEVLGEVAIAIEAKRDLEEWLLARKVRQEARQKTA